MRSRIVQQVAKNFPEIVQLVIDFFTAEETNPELFEKIKAECIATSITNNVRNGEALINMGYLSVLDFRNFAFDNTLIKNGIPSTGIDYLMEALLDNGITTGIPYPFQHMSQEKRFKVGHQFAKFLYDRNLILNTICGWQYIVEKYTNSVFKIEHIDVEGGVSIGTGFYFAASNETIAKYVIITNKHVVENAKTINVFNKADKKIQYKKIISDPDSDLAYIVLEKALPIPTFHFNVETNVLTEIVTIGYPSVPMSKLAYQLAHRGEVNSFIETYHGNKRFIFSAKTSSGNSGSPILDKYGMIIGIATEELFEKEQFFEKGKLPYYAGIPATDIIKSLNTHYS
jgi:hypothetical protein